jgi:CheY-like chemotaxis protein
LQSPDQAVIIIFTPSVIIGQGLKCQFEHWGFVHTKVVTTPGQLMHVAQTTPPALLLLDADLEGEMNCFVLARQLQGESRQIPALFITKALLQPIDLQSNQFITYLHGWLPKPCHTEALWHHVGLLLPGLELRQQQG